MMTYHPASFKSHDDNTPLRKIHVNHPVLLRPLLVEGITGTLPSIKFSILRAKHLRPLSILTAGANTIGVVYKVPISEIRNDDLNVATIVNPTLKSQYTVVTVFMSKFQRLTAQLWVVPPHPVGRCYEAPHWHRDWVSGNCPVEAMIPKLVVVVVPITPMVTFRSHKEHQ